MNKNRILWVVLICLQNLYGQKEASIWYFGEKTGLAFKENNVASLSDGVLFSDEGVSTISDKNGNLLFYTNGETIFNRLHDTMKNGGGLYGHNSASQSSIILPKPGSNSIYYVITIDAFMGNGRGANYSEIDMSLASGLGGVTSKKNIRLQNNTDEKVTVVRHKNQIYYWILIPQKSTQYINAYLVTEKGIDKKPVKSNIGTMVDGAQGYLKASLKGDRIAAAFSLTNRIIVANFDNLNGIVSNIIVLPSLFPYGLEFSPNGRFLYSRSYDRFVQYDLKYKDSTGIVQSLFEIYKAIGFENIISSLQLGIDSKIYSGFVTTNHIASIERPDSAKESCLFIRDKINTGNNECRHGLPNIVNTLFYPRQYIFEYNIISAMCKYKVFFTLHDTLGIRSFRWDFGDSLSRKDNHSTGSKVEHVFNDGGVYNIQLFIEHVDNSKDTINQDINLNRFSNQFEMPEKLVSCDSTLMLDYFQHKASYLWQDSSKESSFFVSQEGIYYLTIKDSNGCIYSDSVNVFFKTADMVYIPNSFSPNNDGINDVFYIEANIDMFNYSIYDRWGGVIKQNKSEELYWDGTKDGKYCPEGVYFINFNSRNCEGNLISNSQVIHLIR